MPEFAWPWMFLLLPLPWLVTRWLPAVAPGTALRLPHHDLALQQQARLGRRRWSAWWLLAWLLLVCAAARPYYFGPPQAPPRSGRAIMLAIDISGSMRATDMVLGGHRVSRFVATRAIVADFISRRQGDKLGLILFGSHAYLVTPLTWDLSTVRTQLLGAAVGLAGRKTAIGDAIAVAVRRLQKLPSEARVLVLLTDGVNTAGHLDPERAARIAEAAGVRIYTIGIGSSRNQAPGIFGALFQQSGGSLNSRLLKRLAQSTGGRFFKATDTDELAAAWRSIARLEPIKQQGEPLRIRHQLFRWPLLGALLLALLGGFWRTRPWLREAET